MAGEGDSTSTPADGAHTSLLQASKDAVQRVAERKRAKRKRRDVHGDGDADAMIVAAAAQAALPAAKRSAAARRTAPAAGACGVEASGAPLSGKGAAVWGTVGDNEQQRGGDSGEEGLMTPEESDSEDGEGWEEADEADAGAHAGGAAGAQAPGSDEGAAAQRQAERAEADDGTHVVEFNATKERRLLVAKARAEEQAAKDKRKKAEGKVTAEDQRRFEAVHRVHVMCLIARAQRFDAFASWEDVRAVMLSHDSGGAGEQVRQHRAAPKALAAFAEWFSGKWTLTEEIDDCSSPERLAAAATAMRGGEEAAAALCCSALRSLNVTARLIVAVDASIVKATVAALKTEGLDGAEQGTLPGVARAGKGKSKGKSAARAKASPPSKGKGKTRAKASPPMAKAATAATAKPSTSPRKRPKRAAAPVVILDGDSDDTGDGNGNAGDNDSGNDSDCVIVGFTPPKPKVSSTPAAAATPVSLMDDDAQLAAAIAMSLGEDGGATAAAAPPEEPTAKRSKQAAATGAALLERRSRADAEEDIQLELALQASRESADAGVAGPSSGGGAGWRRMPAARGEAHAPRSAGDSAKGAHQHAEICWVECFSESDSRWITVDPLSGQVDRPESIGPRRDRPFSYVLGFAGGGAKDVTRRYAVSWQVVERMRTSKHWWYALMAPLERRERAATNALASWGGVAPDEDVYEVPPPPGSAAAEQNAPARAAAMVERRVEAGMPGATAQVTRHMVEDAELKERSVNEPPPTTIAACKNHPRYALERHVKRYEAIYPRKPVGSIKGEMIFLRSAVKELHTRDQWLAEGRRVRPGEQAYKQVPARTNKAKEIRKNRKEIARRKELYGAAAAEGELDEALRDHGDASGAEANEADDEAIADGDAKAGDKSNEEVKPKLPDEMTDLFGEWQTEPWRPEAAADPLKVPKNARGQVDVFSDKMLPQGCAHVAIKGSGPVAKKLGIDYAPAMVGFERARGRSVPKILGVVVAKPNEQLLRDACAEAERERQRKAEQKARDEAMAAWRRLFRTMHDIRKFEQAMEEDEAGEEAKLVRGGHSAFAGATAVGKAARAAVAEDVEDMDITDDTDGTDDAGVSGRHAAAEEVEEL